MPVKPQKWGPRVLITAILLIGAFTLRALGINSVTEWIIIACAVSYLGADIVTLARSYKPPQHF